MLRALPNSIPIVAQQRGRIEPNSGKGLRTIDSVSMHGVVKAIPGAPQTTELLPLGAMTLS
jgi:hypothetical protein